MEHRIVFAGFGGQGLITLGKLVAACAMEEGREVTYFPSYGSEVRGGTANCRVIISDNPIASPLIVEASALLIMNELSMKRFCSALEPGGLMVLNTSLSPLPENADKLKLLTIDATQLADDLGSTKVANMIMLGALNEIEELVDFGRLLKMVGEVLGQRSKELLPLNNKAIEIGRQLARDWLNGQVKASA